MPRLPVDYVSLSVRELEKPVDDWRHLLSLLSPDRAFQLTRGDVAEQVDGTPLVWVTFQNPDPYGVSIQLWGPGAEETSIDTVLDKRGEFVPHIAILSDDFGHTIEDCEKADITMLFDAASRPDTRSWLPWNSVPEKEAHGVLKLTTSYVAVEDRRYPHPGNAENRDRLKSSAE